MMFIKDALDGKAIEVYAIANINHYTLQNLLTANGKSVLAENFEDITIKIDFKAYPAMLGRMKKEMIHFLFLLIADRCSLFSE